MAAAFRRRESEEFAADLHLRKKVRVGKTKAREEGKGIKKVALNHR